MARGRGDDGETEHAVLLKTFERDEQEGLEADSQKEVGYLGYDGGEGAHSNELPGGHHPLRASSPRTAEDDVYHHRNNDNGLLRFTQGLSIRLRFLLLLRSILGFTWLRNIPATCRRLGFRGTIRSVFNYIESDFQPRSTAWLDGLRGLAAFEVYIFHYDDGWIDRTLAWGHGEHMSTSWYYLPFVRTFFASGDAAVCLFFGISGYVLSFRMLKLLRQGPQKHEELLTSLSSAVYRRGIRLYMPVLVETFVLMILCRWFYLPKPVEYVSAPTFQAEVWNWLKSFGHLLMPLRYPDRWDQIQDWYDGGISWTIPLEYYGSLYIYLILLLMSRTTSITVRRCLTAGLVMLSFCKDDWIAAQFLLGMTFADYQLEREHNAKQPQDATKSTSTRWQRLRPAFFVGLFLFGFYMSGIPGGFMYEEYEGDPRVKPRPFYDWFVQPIAWAGLYPERQMDRNILCFATMCTIAGIGETPFLKRILETRPVQYLGRISFGLYLCHIFVRTWLQPWNDASLLMFGYDLETFWKDREPGGIRLLAAYIVRMVPSTMANFIVAGLFERYLDKPSVNAGKWFEKWCLSFGKSSNVVPFT